ncbi:MAG TPA: UDP-N-acetylmuramoyl-tripeptide--D-alanyl-D-alanine ligase [Opitutaceae bacterium]|nr:UDP-N-acetylmuramoyl-tripeptide--D-alanyl-D-alanine ligase [Opitutaceae bacterium]
MPSFSASHLASWTGGQWTALPAAALTGFTQDTRQLKDGQVFVALATDKRDGHEFLAAAQAAGASAALVSRPNASLTLPQLVAADPLRAFQAIAREHRRRFRRPVVGITGSAGKTSTKNLLAKLLGGEPSVLATEGNLNNHIGVPLTLTRLDSAIHEFAVVEAGISEPGEMSVLGSMIEPDYGIVTLVAAAHTQELGGLAGVAREKAVLLEHVRPSGLGVFPKQCWEFGPFQDLPQTSIVVVPEGEQVNAPRVVPFSIAWTANGTTVSLGKRRFELCRVTRGMAQNAALALTLASELGMTDEAMQNALLDWRPAKWRGELRREAGRTLYLDFYNANPASMGDALENFDTLVSANEPRVYVIGCMEELGAESERYHRELGQRLKPRAQDFVYVIGAQAGAVRSGAIASGAAPARIEIVDTLEPVAARLKTFEGAVFIKGSRRYALENALPAGAGKTDTTASEPSSRASVFCEMIRQGPTC